MKKFNYKSPIFKKYIMSYLIVIFVMTLIMSTWSIGNYKKYKRENIKNAEIAAENFGKNFDNMLRTLYYNTDKLTTSKQFSDARIYKNSDKLLEFQKEVKRALYPFTQAEFMAVYFNSRGLYVANGVYSKEDFYGSNFKYGDKTAEEWNAEVIESTDSIKFLPAEYVKYNNMRNKMLPIILSLNNSKIISLVAPEKFDINGYEYSIVTKNGNVVYSELDNYIFPEKSFSEKGWYFANVNGKKRFFVSYPSEFTGITYILSAKKSQVLSSALIYRDTAVVIMLLSLFAAIALALYLSVVNVNPIYQFLNKIKDNMMLEEDDALELDSVGTSILKLVESNENLSKQLDKRFQHMRENFLYRVINGAFDTNEQAEKYCRSFGITLNAKNFFTAVAEINGIERKNISEMDIVEFSAIKTYVFNAFSDEGDKIMPVETNDNRLVFVCSADSNGEELYIERMKKIESDLLKKFGLIISVGIGGTYDGIIGIFYSYSEAVSVVNYMMLSEKTGFLKHGDVSEKNIMYYYPIDLEQRLITLVKNGEETEAEKIFDILYEENIKRRELSPMSFNYLKNALIATFMRISELIFKEGEQTEKNIDLITDDIRNENRPVAFFEKTSELYNQMCSAVNMSAKGKNLKLKDKIEEYLDNNFKNTEMNLYMISKEFNFSESYFSRIFKEIFDCNFSYYLEQKRISKAIEILKTQNYKINEITFMVGYSSAQVMRRAFKRITGITPDEYRKSQE